MVVFHTRSHCLISLFGDLISVWCIHLENALLQCLFTYSLYLFLGSDCWSRISTCCISNSHEFKKWLYKSRLRSGASNHFVWWYHGIRAIWSQYYTFVFIDALWNSAIDGLGQAVLICPVLKPRRSSSSATLALSLSASCFIILWNRAVSLIDNGPWLRWSRQTSQPLWIVYVKLSRWPILCFDAQHLPTMTAGRDRS
jgi:hypothetical protein